MNQHVKRFFAALFCAALCLPLIGMSTGLVQAQTQSQTQSRDMVENLSKLEVDSEAVLWLSVAYSENLADIGYYLEQYPDGEYAGIANRKYDYYAELARKKNSVIQSQRRAAIIAISAAVLFMLLFCLSPHGRRTIRFLNEQGNLK